MGQQFFEQERERREQRGGDKPISVYIDGHGAAHVRVADINADAETPQVVTDEALTLEEATDDEVEAEDVRAEVLPRNAFHTPTGSPRVAEDAAALVFEVEDLQEIATARAEEAATCGVCRR